MALLWAMSNRLKPYPVTKICQPLSLEILNRDDYFLLLHCWELQVCRLYVGPTKLKPAFFLHVQTYIDTDAKAQNMPLA